MMLLAFAAFHFLFLLIFFMPLLPPLFFAMMLLPFSSSSLLHDAFIDYFAISISLSLIIYCRHAFFDDISALRYAFATLRHMLAMLFTRYFRHMRARCHML